MTKQGFDQGCPGCRMLATCGAANLRRWGREPAWARISRFLMNRGHGEKGLWPLQDFLELPAFVSAVPSARLHARQVLQEWDLARLGESAGLLVTELITNAVRVSQMTTHSSPVRLWLMSDAAQLLILVWDASPQPPQRRDANGDAENGRGLTLVEAVSEQWGWRSCRGIGGKVVWALLRL